MQPVRCGSCGAAVRVRKSSWDQTSIQWCSQASAACLERRASTNGPFIGCAALRDAVREAAVSGDITFPLD
ncbi:MAG: ferredoxin [Mycobacteriales bacterium]